MDINCRGSLKAVRDATRTPRMGLRTIRTLTDKLRIRYGGATDTKVYMDSTDKSNMFATNLTRTLQMLQMSLRREKTIRKSLNIFHIRNPATIRRYIRGCVTGVLAKILIFYKICNIFFASYRHLCIIFLRQSVTTRKNNNNFYL